MIVQSQDVIPARPGLRSGGRDLAGLQDLEIPKSKITEGIKSGMTSRADQRPGRDAYDRFEELRAELDSLLSALDQLTQRTTRLVETVPD